MSPLPPLPPPPPPNPRVPFYLGGYVYPTRASVRDACSMRHSFLAAAAAAQTQQCTRAAAITPWAILLRVQALAACNKMPTGSRKLCKKMELVNHSSCAAGWCEDFEGWWMATAAKGCGTAGFNSWTGPAGAFCCVE
jgi:hypothetical protein